MALTRRTAVTTAAGAVMMAGGLSHAKPRDRGGAAPLDTSRGEWPVYGGDHQSRKFSPLDQITARTIDRLEIAWIWDAPDNAIVKQARATNAGFRTDHFKGTPIMVDGRLFVRTPLGIVQALDPGTGRVLWSHDPGGYAGERPFSYGFTTRGVAYWKDGEGAARILSTTSDRRLIALDAETGRPIRAFGANGVVALDDSLRRMSENPWWVNYANQVPVIVNDVIVIGSVVTDTEAGYLPKDKMDQPVVPPGDVRGFDVRTGALKWTFHSIPQAGETGVETWGDESWRWVGSTNVWSLISADPELGLVYLPFSAPTFNYYGGFRPGDNLFSDSIVCLEARTGRRVWHFQTIHHDVFDYDLPAAPVLVDINVGGRNVAAVAQLGKNGFAFVFDRVTGKPVWPIEERPAPQSSLPGERTAATQPFPTAPPPFAGQGMADDRILSLTPELNARARAMLAPYDRGPLYTPLSRRGAVLSPGISGGANWTGGAFDPGTGRLYVTAQNDALIRGIEPSADFFGYKFKQYPSRIDGLPLVNPPWATITAIDLNRGDLAWSRANGPGPKAAPALAALKLPDLGTMTKSNPMVTATLLFAATGAATVQGPVPTRAPIRTAPAFDRARLSELKFDTHATLRAYDKATGAVVWEHAIGPSFNDGGAPMTYLWKGRQYLLTPTGGGADSSHLIAFALPES